MKCFLDPQCWRDFEQFGCDSDDNKAAWRSKWATLDNAYVNFTHFARIKEDDSGHAFTKFGILHAWRRHAAYFMGARFPRVDIFIPIAYVAKDFTVTPESMSGIVISVKNHSGTKHDSLSKEELEENYVLGTLNDTGQYLAANVKSNLLMSLGTIHFLYPRGQVKAAEPNLEPHEWIEFTEHNPYIAFAMSIGSRHISREKRFVPEPQVWKTGN